MARVLANPFGELRGKLGGIVFGRNKSGQIVRSRIFPTQPNNQAQVSARARFSSASQAWCHLAASVKSAWRDFAALPSRFNPLRNVNTGQYTGSQAYTALRTIVTEASRWAMVPDLFDDSGAGTFVVTTKNYAASDTPPAYGLSGNIAMSTGAPAGMQFTGFTLNSAGFMSIHVGIFGVTSLDVNSMVDEFGHNFGFSTYISDAVKKPGNRPKNPFAVNLGSTLPIDTISSGTLVGENGFTLSARSLKTAPAIKYGLNVGDVHDVTLVAVSNDGMTKKIGMLATTIV